MTSVKESPLREQSLLLTLKLKESTEVALHPLESKSNYDYGKRFCLLLAERFTGEAREWWLSRRESGRATPNCWQAPRAHHYEEPGIDYVSFRNLLK